MSTRDATIAFPALAGLHLDVLADEDQPLGRGKSGDRLARDFEATAGLALTLSGGAALD